MQGGLTRAIFPGEAIVSFSIARETTRSTMKIISEFDGRVFDTGQPRARPGFYGGKQRNSGDACASAAEHVRKYDINGRTGRWVLRFRVARPGSYKIAGRYDDGQQHEEAVFAVGNPHIGRFVGLILGGIACILAIRRRVQCSLIVLIEAWQVFLRSES